MLSHAPRNRLAGHPLLHHEVAWYATDDDKLLGIIIRDKVDNDFSWVVMEMQGQFWRAIDVEASYPDISAATAALHQRMAQGSL
jgi:hypothetical protein